MPFWQEKVRTLLTIFGIALGVAILVAIDLTSNTAVAEFDQTVQQVAGQSSVTIRGNAVPLEANLVYGLEKFEEVQQATPLIQETINVTKDDKSRRVLLLGFDLLQGDREASRVVRDYEISLAEGIEFFDLFVNEGYVLVPYKLVDRLGLEAGNEIQTAISDKPLIAAGIVSGPDLDLIRDGDFIISDIAIADSILRRNGRIDQIDIITNSNIEENEAIASLKEKLPSNLIIEKPEQRGNNVDQMIAAFRFNLKALGHLSLLVGAFLIYNTMNISVLRRRPMIGTLRALGIKRNTIRFTFLAEGLFFGLIGGLIGIVLGTIMSALLLDLVTDAISINFFQSEANRLILSPMQYLTALSLGLLFSAIAAINPANEAAKTAPSNVMNSNISRTNKTTEFLYLGIAGFCLIASLIILKLPVTPGIPWIGYTASTLIILSGLFISHRYLEYFLRSVKKIYSRLFKGEGLLAVAGIQGSINRTSVAVAGLFLSVAMCVSVSVMISSFRETVIVWMNQVLKADVYIVPDTTVSAATGIDRELEAALLNVEGIEIIEPFQARVFEYNGRKARVAGGRFNQERFAANMIDKSITVEELSAAKESDHVIISEAFALKNKLEKGNTIELPSQSGSFKTEVAGVYYDYSSEQGYVVMDRLLFEKLYGAQQFDSIALFVEEGRKPQDIRESIQQLPIIQNGEVQVDMRLSGELRTFALTQFDKTFAITYALQLVAVGVAVLGIITTLLAQILDRRKELWTLRTIGASAKRIGKLILLESSIISIAGILFGVLMGLVLSYILTTIIMLQSFGWTIQFQVPVFVLVNISIVILIATLVSTIIPIREAVKI